MVEKTITLYYKSGGSCQHTSDRPEAEWRELAININLEFTKTHPGLLRLQGPFGVHRLSEMASFHITDYDPPEAERTLGFV